MNVLRLFIYSLLLLLGFAALAVAVDFVVVESAKHLKLLIATNENIKYRFARH